MTVLSEYMKADHRACDAEFANMENAVADETASLQSNLRRIIHYMFTGDATTPANRLSWQERGAIEQGSRRKI